MAHYTVTRIVWDMFIVFSVFLLPWIATVVFLFLGMLFFDNWHEGIIGAVLLDIVLFSGNVGLHSVAMILGFCAVYFILIRVKHLARIA